jgi:hypothetical protein
VEFLIKRTDGDWFDLHVSRYAETLKPRSVPSEVVAGWGDHRIRVLGVDISFSYEDPGFQVVFEGELSESDARRIADEICLNIVEATGQAGAVFPL